MGGWFLSILCTSVAAGGLTAVVAVHPDAEALPAAVSGAEAASVLVAGSIAASIE